uniref:NACHT domain-containing protein n=1 Tax=Erpetoichthys calabaricus TaxID=27687 RepID=A0A8C4RJ90_ERPCA
TPVSLGTDLMEEIQTHKVDVSKSTVSLEEQPTPGDPRTRAVDFEIRYTELLVINQYRRTYSETHHELIKTGKSHAELVEDQVKEKCERVWTQQLFRKNPESETFPRIVVASGVAGIGKTTMVQKIMFDWARGTQYQKFAFVFLFKFRELNLLDSETEPQIALTRMIVRHYKHLNDTRLKEILKKTESLLFIFDGLDEYKHKLDFTERKLCSDPDDYFPVHILVTSLVSGTLLKGCSVLITSRPTALEGLVMEKVDRFVEILGFFPDQRLMFFKKFFGDSDLGTEVFRYVEENAILYTMCFNPSYCWIICSVLKSHFMTPEEERGAAPRTITELFVMFLHNILTNHKREAENQREIMSKLGKMAYYGVANRIFVFYDKFEISSFGLHSELSSPFLSGFLKEILQRESTLEHTTYTFFHLILQEFVAACSFYFDPSAGVEELLIKLDSCKDGRFEIFIQFLAGLARYSVFKILGGILGEFKRKTAVTILEWVRQKAEQAFQGRDKREALRVCQWLYEIQNQKLTRDSIGKNLKLDFSNTTLSPLDCAVVGSVIHCCTELEQLNLASTNLTPECIKRLTPGLISISSLLFSHLYRLRSCDLRADCCLPLSLALSTKHSQLAVLELRKNKLEDSGVRILCEGLRNKNCKLKTLRLRSCGLTSGCCTALSSVLCTEHSHLTDLELGGNNLEDSGALVYLSSSYFLFPSCLHRLWLCGLTSECCEALSSTLSTQNSCMTDLRLEYNKLDYKGVCALCEGLKEPSCKLEKLW